LEGLLEVPRFGDPGILTLVVVELLLFQRFVENLQILLQLSHPVAIFDEGFLVLGHHLLFVVLLKAKFGFKLPSLCIFVFECIFELEDGPVLFLDELVVLSEDVPHLIPVHTLAVRKLDLILSHLLPHDVVFVEERLLLSLCIFELVDEELDISLDFCEFRDPSAEFFVLVD
jgi:hypothetical protein